MRRVGKKLLYISIGLLATLLGLIGIFLPGLPTVPFILVALWAFSNSSTYLHSWLTKLPLLKKAHQEIEVFQQTKAVSLQTKYIAQGFAWGSVIVTLLMKNIVITLIMTLLAVSCSIAMFILPTLKPAD